MSLLARFRTDASNAWNDAYGSLFLGDDAGKAAKIVVCLQPTRKKNLDLGMTLLEINGRAYVRTVTPGSAVAKAGVMPRDSVQFATVYKEHWSALAEEQDDENDVNEIARAYALDCESKGMRVGYEDLRRILADGMDPLQSAFTSPNPSANGINGWAKVPSTIHVCSQDTNERPLSPYQKEVPRPVVMVLRRTRQRPSNNGLAIFRLDDECDFSASLVRRLAPTTDMEQPLPDAWEELVHDGTDWLLGGGSMLPPKRADGGVDNGEDELQPPNGGSIPLDRYEMKRATKLAKLRSRMAAENMHVDRTDDVEAATIRGMIQKAVGLAFVRASKVVLGVSIHAGSGIVISRLPDGTWSAPSAIGTWGLGLGVQFGLEVAEYIFILQTAESLAHFCKGGSFTIGGNVGAAVAGMGREAYGAASVGNVFCASPSARRHHLEDEYNDEDDSQEGTVEDQRVSSVGIAPIVAYAKSQGLYVGVSLEGSRIFTRDEINARTYKFSVGREVTANDILSGKVATPPEAEDLYQALHSVEFTHEMSCLPRPPECLRKDSPNSWHFDRSTLGNGSSNHRSSRKNPFGFLQNLTDEEDEEINAFETQFKKFMYGGVSVQRLIPNSESRSGKTRKERRTLWMMLPEVGALRLGFVSKLSDGDGTISNKSSTQRAKAIDIGDDGNNTVASEPTLDSALVDQKDSSNNPLRGSNNVQLSNKHSVALTDVTVLSQEPHVQLQFQPQDQTEHLRIISIQDVSGESLLFLANNFREAELLYCGLKLLLERETSRLSVRGGLPITALGGRAKEGAMSPAAARGFPETAMPDALHLNSESRRTIKISGYESSEMDDGSTAMTADSASQTREVPLGRKSWGNVPGRAYMRNQASSTEPLPVEQSQLIRLQPGLPETVNNSLPKYQLGQLVVRDIATKVQLPLPLPLCRVLLLDSSSPVITKWEKDRGDVDFSKTGWTFPPATPRELERHDSEHQLIASGSMMGAHRTSTFGRIRNGTTYRLSETQIVDADDSEKLAFTISERMPRRGFSIKVKVIVRALKDDACEATVLGEVRPVGKNMTNQGAVHKAFQLVVNEIKARYGTDGTGLLGGFLHVVKTMPPSNGGKVNGTTSKSMETKSRGQSNSPTLSNSSPTKKKSGLVSLQDVMKESQAMQHKFPPVNRERPTTPSFPIKEDTPKRLRKPQAGSILPPDDEFAPYPPDENNPQPMTIEVKPLPKIRLSLMPSPREEDEEEESSNSQKKHAPKKKKKSSRSKSRRSSGSRTSSRRSVSSSRRIPDAR